MNRLLALAVVAVLPAGASAEGLRPLKSGLVVHEWGVFRVSEDEEFANAHLRNEWDKLPPFVYGHVKGRVVPENWGAIEIRLRPVIFFHADVPTEAFVQVRFPGGMAGVWYPGTESPAVERGQRQPKIGDSLNWNLRVSQCPQGWTPRSPAPLAAPDRHWFARIREVKSAEIFAKFGPNAQDCEREKFLYYDGLFPQGKWMRIDVAKDRVGLTNRVKHPVFDVTVVDRRDDKTVRVGRIEKLDAGESVKEVRFEEVAASEFSERAAEALLKELTAAGLFEDEAQSLVDLWKKDMFETPGLHAFYRIPQSEYQARMPLTINPQPKSVVRVGLIFHGHLEPDFSDKIMELVKQLDADTFARRDAAMKKLLAIGPPALVELKRIAKKTNLSIEVRERVEALVRKWSAKEALDVKGAN